MRRFCSVCGEVTDELIENKCRRCYASEKRLIKIAPRLETKACRHCRRYLRNGKWTVAKDEKSMLEEAARASLEGSIRVEMKAPSLDIQVREPVRTSASVYSIPITVTARGRIQGLEIEASESAEVRLSYGICDECSRLRGGYYEAIVQLRGPAPLGEAEREKFDRFVSERVAKSGDRRAFIARIEDLHEGLDFYLGSAKLARKVARALRGKYGGTITESAKLFGKKEGKELYRVTIAVRLPKMEKFK